MTLHEFIKQLDADQRAAYAQRAETTVAYLYQIAGGHSKPSAKLVRRLSDASDGKVSKEELLPEVFGDIPAEQAAA